MRARNAAGAPLFHLSWSSRAPPRRQAAAASNGSSPAAMHTDESMMA
jgi:hypothetical protein